jgi:hypothetical protein
MERTGHLSQVTRELISEAMENVASLFPLAEDQWRWSIGVWSDDITSYMHWLGTDFLESIESSPREAFEAAVAALARWAEETEEKEA